MFIILKEMESLVNSETNNAWMLSILKNSFQRMGYVF